MKTEPLGNVDILDVEMTVGRVAAPELSEITVVVSGPREVVGALGVVVHGDLKAEVDVDVGLNVGLTGDEMPAGTLTMLVEMQVVVVSIGGVDTEVDWP